ncbi:17455_t:CDS:2 [Cetraspora pellucida]|uniref:17455_t:CDS:1 n=1 Tax=Cetraspora pellucida TaxID=1433469 RepID=A0A9N9HER8_9GLOM|nr:17455_t:CDS:2 [Cetraspora pellucida]
MNLGVNSGTTDTTNSSQKLIAQQIKEKLIHHTQAEKIKKDEISNETTIKNWISGFSHHWKEAIALWALDETKNSEPF